MSFWSWTNSKTFNSYSKFHANEAIIRDLYIYISCVFRKQDIKTYYVPDPSLYIRRIPSSTS